MISKTLLLPTRYFPPIPRHQFWAVVRVLGDAKSRELAGYLPLSAIADRCNVRVELSVSRKTSPSPTPKHSQPHSGTYTAADSPAHDHDVDQRVHACAHVHAAAAGTTTTSAPDEVAESDSDSVPSQTVCEREAFTLKPDVCTLVKKGALWGPTPSDKAWEDLYLIDCQLLVLHLPTETFDDDELAILMEAAGAEVSKAENKEDREPEPSPGSLDKAGATTSTAPGDGMYRMYGFV